MDLIDHQSTKQKSIRVRLEGASAPQEILVFGAHFNSIALFGNGNAPGADDDASGSSNLLEVLRVVLTQPQTARSLEFSFTRVRKVASWALLKLRRPIKKQSKT